MAHKKLSKRYGLTKLAAGWREQIFLSIISTRLKTAVAILSATGCRPSELERGVVVQLKAEKLCIGIYGSKVDAAAGRGQPLRLLEVEANSPWGEFLVQQVSLTEHSGMLVKYDAGGVSQRLREKSKLLWPKRLPLISAYTYRHYLAKSMKESGMSADIIARTLGHASDYSVTAYGRAGVGKKSAGAHGVITAAASNPVRHSFKSERVARLKSRKALEFASVQQE